MVARLCLLSLFLTTSTWASDRAAVPSPDELRKKADGGDVGALVELAHLSLDSAAGVDYDPEFILASFKRGSEAGSGMAHYGLAKCFVLGIGTDPSPEQAFTHASKSADLGEPEGIRYLGNCHLYGRGTPVDKAKGIELYKKAIGLGCTMARYSYAFYLTRNSKDEKSNREGIAIIEDLIEYEHGDAAYLLGSLYHDGIAGLDHDRTKAMRYYKMAAGWESADGLHQVGNMLLQEKQPQSAIPWLVKAVNRGSSPACWTLAKILKADPELQEEPDQWVRYAELAAIRGNRFAQDQTGAYYYSFAPDDKKDWVKAKKYFLMAAKQGRCHCWDHLASIHVWGKHGVEKDFAEAIKFCREHFEHEHRSAQTLGMILTHETPYKDSQKLKIKGFAALLSAVERGSTLTPKYLDELRKRLGLSDTDLAQAQKLHEEGFPSPGCKILEGE